MKDLIIDAFPHCIQNGCLQQSDREVIEILDDSITQKSIISPFPLGSLNFPFFKILNPQIKIVNVLSIDNCILFDIDGEKCDFATFCEKKIVFVEIKKGLGNVEQFRSQKKTKALIQLKETLRKFHNKINFNGYRVFACLCVGYDCPSPAAPASDLNNLVEFINDFNTELIEGNEVSF